MTTNNDQLSSWTRISSKALLKAKLAPKVMVTVWWSAAGLIHYGFLNPSDIITSEKYAQQIDALINVITATGIGQQKVPSSSPRPQLTTRCTTNALKVEWIGLWSFASSALVTWPLTNWLTSSSFSTRFFTENASTTSRRQKMLSKSSSNPETQIFMLQK